MMPSNMSYSYYPFYMPRYYPLPGRPPDIRNHNFILIEGERNVTFDYIEPGKVLHKSGTGDLTVRKGIGKGTILNLGGSGNCTIGINSSKLTGEIEQNVTINMKDTVNLTIFAQIDDGLTLSQTEGSGAVIILSPAVEQGTFNMGGTGNIHFSYRPSEKVKVNNSGTGKVFIYERYSGETFEFIYEKYPCSVTRDYISVKKLYNTNDYSF